MLNIFRELKYPKWFTQNIYSDTLTILLNGQFRISALGRIIFTKINKRTGFFTMYKRHSSKFFCEKCRRILIVIRLFLALFECSSTGSIWLLPPQFFKKLVAASTEVLKKSQIFQKCAKCTLIWVSNYEIYF